MKKRKKGRGKLISGYRGYFPLMRKSFPADTELRITNYESGIIQRILISHKILHHMMMDRLQNIIKLLNYRNLERIRDDGLKTSARDYGLAGRIYSVWHRVCSITDYV